MAKIINGKRKSGGNYPLYGDDGKDTIDGIDYTLSGKKLKC